jgi:hypothetical protein
MTLRRRKSTDRGCKTVLWKLKFDSKIDFTASVPKRMNILSWTIIHNQDCTQKVRDTECTDDESGLSLIAVSFYL